MMSVEQIKAMVESMYEDEDGWFNSSDRERYIRYLEDMVSGLLNEVKRLDDMVQTALDEIAYSHMEDE